MNDSTVVKGGITLAVIAAICTVLVAATHRITADRIVANEQVWLERSLQPLLAYDGDSRVADRAARNLERQLREAAALRSGEASDALGGTSQQLAHRRRNPLLSIL